MNTKGQGGGGKGGWQGGKSYPKSTLRTLPT